MAGTPREKKPCEHCKKIDGKCHVGDSSAKCARCEEAGKTLQYCGVNTQDYWTIDGLQKVLLESKSECSNDNKR